MEEALAKDTGLTVVLEEAKLKGRCTQKKTRRRTDLLSDSEIATLDLRFAVGDMVMCCITSGSKDEDSWQEGVVVERCYREEEFPSGHYAAVRARGLFSLH